MTIIDLSYAKEAAPSPDSIHSMALFVRGWSVGWATFEGEVAKACGSLKVKDHHEGAPVPAARRAISIYGHVAQIAVSQRVKVLLSETQPTKSPLWSLPPVVSLMVGAVYGDVDDWEKHVGRDKKELKAWATVILGKPPTTDLEYMALGLGAAGAEARRPQALVSAVGLTRKQ